MIEATTISAFLNMFGVPIVVMLWFMFRTEKIFLSTEKSINENTKTLATLCEAVRQCPKK